MATKNLSLELKEDTWELHKKLETTQFSARWMAKSLPLESYIGFLRSFAVIHGVLEHQVKKLDLPWLAAVYPPKRYAFCSVWNDATHFADTGILDIPPAVHAALAIAQNIRKYGAENPTALLGYFYVLEGACQGAKTLGPLAVKQFDLQEDAGASYFSRYGQQTDAEWLEFKAALDVLNLDSKERDDVIGAAGEFYEGLYSLLQELFPFDRRAMRPMVTSVNPEAGAHAMTEVPEEIVAALTAADECWEEFPYFEARYGERGRRFAASDSVWLASLCSLSDTEALEQIEWMAAMLCARGMPTYLLERHISILAVHCRRLLPQKEQMYRRLDIMVNVLQEKRQAVLGGNTLETFVEEIDPEIDSFLDKFSMVMVAAAVDELNGRPRAWESIQEWISENSLSTEWQSKIQSAFTSLKLRMTQEK